MLLISQRSGLRRAVPVVPVSTSPRARSRQPLHSALPMRMLFRACGAALTTLRLRLTRSSRQTRSKPSKAAKIWVGCTGMGTLRPAPSPSSTASATPKSHGLVQPPCARGSEPVSARWMSCKPGPPGAADADWTPSLCGPSTPVVGARAATSLEGKTVPPQSASRRTLLTLASGAAQSNLRAVDIKSKSAFENVYILRNSEHRKL